MKNKFLVVVLYSLVFVSGCQKEDNSSDPSSLSITTLMQSLFYNERYEMRFDYDNQISDYLIDGESFYNVKKKETTFKYVFKNDYVQYDETHIINDKYKIDIDFIYAFKSLLNVNYFSSNFSQIDENRYKLIGGKASIYDRDFFPDTIKDIQISFLQNDETIKYDYILNNNYSFSLSYSPSTYHILMFGKTDKDYNEFYNRQEKTVDEVYKMISSNEDFVLILTSPTCSACANAQGLYYEFSLEYPNQNYYSLNVQKLNSNNTKKMIAYFKETYDNQSLDFKHSQYLTYPEDTFLTPTAIRFSEGQSKYVLLSFSEKIGFLFYTLAFE